MALLFALSSASGADALETHGSGAAHAGAAPRNIVTYEVTNYGTRHDDLDVTFGSIFARGDVPKGESINAVDGHGAEIPLQLDRKATHPDGSLRHGVVTLIIPHLAMGASIPVTLRRTAGAPTAEPVVPLADLPADFDAVVTLLSNGRRLAVSARSLLAQGKVERWLAGSYVSEWWVAGPFRDQRGAADPHLHVEFGIRCYGKDRPLRVEVDVENVWTWVPHPRTEFYDAQVALGRRTVFAKAGMTQPAHTRWRVGFWWSDPVAVYVKQNLAYLKKARVVPNYDPDLVVSQAAVTQLYRRFEASDRSPMAAGILMKYMPTTGGRPDIAPLPQWQALFLLTMDPRLYQVMLQTADLGASYCSHYRSERTGRPVTLEDEPRFSTDGNFVGRSGQIDIPDTGGYKDPLVPDAAHEPALDFIPYLVTGDRFYLEELQFWSQWNETGTDPHSPGYANALVYWDQVRAQAWSLRTLAQAEYITPDDDPFKSVLRRELRANVEHYDADFLKGGPKSNRLGLIWPIPQLERAGRYIPPWQDDFFTWSLAYVQSLGDVDAQALLGWKLAFVVGRMIAPGFCWILAPSYGIAVRDSPQAPLHTSFAEIYQATLSDWLAKTGEEDRHAPCASDEMAAELKLPQAGEMVQPPVSDGFAAQMQPALAAAVDFNEPGAEKAWKIFSSRAAKPDYSAEPGWDIVPWSGGE
jgi:hypothetical protein